MSFVTPHLWPLFIVVLVVLLVLRSREKVACERLSVLRVVSSRRGILLFPTVIIFLCIFSLLRPYRGSREVMLPAGSGDTVVLLDISHSMLARDVTPTRLDAAKRKIEDLLKLVRVRAPGDRIGLVLFAGEAATLAPLTADYDALLHYVRSISPELITAGGSSLLSAVYAGSAMLREAGASHATLLLLSDGEDSTANISEAVRIAREGAISVSAIGFGTTEGAPVPYQRGGFLKSPKGEIVISRFDERSLRKIAEDTGGLYFKARLDGGDLEKIILPPASQLKETSTGHARSVTVYNEWGPYLFWILLAGLFILVAFRHHHLVLSLLLVWPLREVAAQERPLTPYQAWRAYSAGEYEEAKRGFSEARIHHPEDLSLLRGEATADFRQNNFESAEKLFGELASRSKTGRERFEGLYNRGNALLALGRFKDAVASYEASLKMKPGDERAEANLKLAKELLKNPPTPSPTPSTSPTSDDGAKNPQNGEGSGEDTESQSGKETPAPSPAPSASPSPSTSPQSEDGATPSPTASSDKAEEGGTPTPPSDSTQDGKDGDSDKEKSDEELSELQAKAWLESLPEYPLLLRRKTGRTPRGTEQTW